MMFQVRPAFFGRQKQPPHGGMEVGGSLFLRGCLVFFFADEILPQLCGDYNQLGGGFNIFLCPPKGNFIFQPLICRCELLVAGRIEQEGLFLVVMKVFFVFRLDTYTPPPPQQPQPTTACFLLW